MNFIGQIDWFNRIDLCDELERLYKQGLMQSEYKNRLKEEYLKKKMQEEKATLTFTPQLNSRSLKMITPSRRAGDNYT